MKMKVQKKLSEQTNRPGKSKFSEAEWAEARRKFKEREDGAAGRA